MQVHQIDTDRRHDVDQFVRFPFQLYRGSSCWVPPLLSSARGRLYGKRHPFYRTSDADFFVARRGNEVVGRIAVVEPHQRNEYRAQRGAFFCLFDAVDDSAVSTALFSAAFDWARKRGLEEISGPEAFVAFDGLGTLVKGFEHRPAMQQTYNYSYYDRLIREAGFEKQTDYYSCYATRDFALPERVHRVVQKVKERRGFRVLHLRSRAEVRAVAPQVIAAYNAAFSQNREFVPVAAEAEERIIGYLLGVTFPDLVTVVARGEEIVGFALGFPDVSAALQRCRGRLFPFGWAMIQREFQRTSWINFNGGGILPQYQGLGVTGILYQEMERMFRSRGFQHADIVQINEQNTRMMNEMESLGVDFYKAHRIYQREM
ncbi:MAG: GNAT family N-acetyltransferase [Anaerolineae bacterium]|nr:GNAT family N-acetyltransferase [Anaerolineae bacterium]